MSRFTTGLLASSALCIVQSTDNSSKSMRWRSVVGPNLHLHKPWSRPAGISCNALPRCDKTLW
jgi:hypothetical protein